MKHLELLGEKINSYFPRCDLQPMDSVRNPFSDSISLGHLRINEQEEFMELKTDRTLKLKFTEIELSHFWQHIKNEYPLLSKRKITILLRLNKKKRTPEDDERKDESSIINDCPKFLIKNLSILY